MIRYLFVIALLLIASQVGRRYPAEAPPEQRKSRKITLALTVLAIIMLLLALTGRMHWLGALFAALLPLVRQLLALLVPYLLQKHGNTKSGPPASSGPMTREEALKVLGLKPGYTREQVIAAHRKLMQKVHPDRGGNDYLAAQLNEAKALLLDALA